MNFGKIILPDFLIADLYKSCLVDLNAYSKKKLSNGEENLNAEAESKTISSSKINFLGENLKNITIIVNQQNSIHLNKDDLTFLISILKACELNLNDIVIVNIAKQPINYIEIKTQLSALQIVLFNAEPSLIGLPFKIPPFQIQTYADTAIMLAPALSDLNKSDKESKLLKTKLWNSLRQLFSIR